MIAALLAFLFGVAAGWASMASLRWQVKRLGDGERVARTLGMQLLRFVALAGILAVLAHSGPKMLLTAAAGLLVSRTWLLQRRLWS